MKHYVYSDPHFNHKNVIAYSDRPFINVEEMNEFMIEEFNRTVSFHDKVYILGDFGFGKKEDITEIVRQLNGYKVLIMGNHDQSKPKQWWIDTGFDEVHKDPILIQGKFILSHRPIPMIEPMPYVNIHGHIHQNPAPTRMHFNVSVEQTEYRPVNLKTIEQEIKKRGLKLQSELFGEDNERHNQ